MSLMLLTQMILTMIMNHLIIWILLGPEAWEMEEGSKEMYVFHGEKHYYEFSTMK